MDGPLLSLLPVDSEGEEFELLTRLPRTPPKTATIMTSAMTAAMSHFLTVPDREAFGAGSGVGRLTIGAGVGGGITTMGKSS